MVRWRRVVRRGTRVRRSPLAKYRSFGGSVWESNPSTVCLERSTGFEVREAHRVPRRFQACNYAPFQRCEFTIAGRITGPVTCTPPKVSPSVIAGQDALEDRRVAAPRAAKHARLHRSVRGLRATL